jgi:hypothetical protein
VSCYAMDLPSMKLNYGTKFSNPTINYSVSTVIPTRKHFERLVNPEFPKVHGG